MLNSSSRDLASGVRIVLELERRPESVWISDTLGGMWGPPIQSCLKSDTRILSALWLHFDRILMFVSTFAHTKPRRGLVWCKTSCKRASIVQRGVFTTLKSLVIGLKSCWLSSTDRMNGVMADPMVGSPRGGIQTFSPSAPLKLHDGRTLLASHPRSL